MWRLNDIISQNLKDVWSRELNIMMLDWHIRCDLVCCILVAAFIRGAHVIFSPTSRSLKVDHTGLIDTDFIYSAGFDCFCQCISCFTTPQSSCIQVRLIIVYFKIGG